LLKYRVPEFPGRADACDRRRRATPSSRRQAGGSGDRAPNVFLAVLRGTRRLRTSHMSAERHARACNRIAPRPRPPIVVDGQTLVKAGLRPPPPAASALTRVRPSTFRAAERSMSGSGPTRLPLPLVIASLARTNATRSP
jgi:hypothetical protein